jgi:competence protein ComEC
VHPGERWTFTVRLRRPHGNLNPNGFDYEAWLLERGIGATGYVPAAAASSACSGGAIQRWTGRAGARSRARALPRGARRDPGGGILSALAVGDQRAIAAEEWRLFSRTGVTHLMSISGLHVTLVSGLVGWLVSALWRRFRGWRCACLRARRQRPRRSSARSAIRCSRASRCRRSAPATW